MTPSERFRAALAADDRVELAAVLAEAPAVLRDVPLPYGQPALARARSVETARLLLEHGADPADVGAWWAPGFNVVGRVESDVGRFLVERGAPLTPHAAAGLGLVDRLAAMLDADPTVVHQPGGDGATPLHFARDVATARHLVQRGADVDARDDDHASTPAQWLVKDAPDVARFLLDHGATPDLFLAAALGDRALAERLVETEPTRLRARIGLDAFPSIGHQGLGGTILQWTLGFNCYAHQVAARHGHHELFRFMDEASDVTTRFLVSCVMARRAEAEALARAHPDLVASLPLDDLRLPALYCWETNVDAAAVELMLDVGFPVDTPERSHGFSPLHNAAWGGYADLVDLLITRGHPVDGRDPTFDATPLGFALHCCLEDGRHPEGDYGRVVAALIDAGSPWDPSIHPTGHAEIDAVLTARGA